VVERLHELAADEARELVGRREDHVGLEAAGGELRERLLERLERRDANAHVLALAELLQHGGVEVVGVVVRARCLS
jgi:hypothetical protein